MHMTLAAAAAFCSSCMHATKGFFLATFCLNNSGRIALLMKKETVLTSSLLKSGRGGGGGGNKQQILSLVRNEFFRRAALSRTAGGNF